MPANLTTSREPGAASGIRLAAAQVKQRREGSRVARWAAVIACIPLYFLFLEVRVTIPDSDLTRVVEEFVSIGMSSYNLREPLYWAPGKLLTAIFDDGWIAIFLLDIAVFACLLFAFRSRPLPAVFIIALFLSPLFVLGINNIHRQLVGFAVWLVVERTTLERGPYKTFAWHLIPFLIHTSMGILSLIYYICYALIKRDIIILSAIGASILIVVGLFPDAVAGFFREGTETTTSLVVYSAWAFAVAFPVIAAARKTPFIILFYLLGAAASAVLFTFSGGSSGSRFFIMFITIVSIWVVGRVLPESDDGPILRLGFLLAICALLAGPTFATDFSMEILRSAVLRVPFGGTY
ncbi:EpsG family protein [Erythrobacter sp. GH1-10]|uniref:EpsG family protein n=1 Tax=Erythrobacter sp. GH1-10 TaxID=3349334 RepID=UPI00387806BF